jgi:hypothetical protein
MIDTSIEGDPIFRKVNYISPDENIFDVPYIKKHVINYVPEDAMHMMLPMIKAIEHVCALNGTRLKWGSWIPGEHRIYDSFNFNDYIEIPKWEYFIYNKPLSPDETFKTIAKDGLHPGLDYQTTIADTFYGAL